MSKSDKKARRADTAMTGSCISVGPPGLFGIAATSGGSRHRQRLCRPSRPESHSHVFRSLCFGGQQSLAALPGGTANHLTESF